jgi:hypothetical protein
MRPFLEQAWLSKHVWLLPGISPELALLTECRMMRHIAFLLGDSFLKPHACRFFRRALGVGRSRNRLPAAKVARPNWHGGC